MYSFLPVRREPKQFYSLLVLPERRSAHMQHVGQALELDGSIDTEVWSRARRNRTGQSNVNNKRALACGRVYAHYLALDDPVSRVHFHRLAEFDVFVLSF